MAHAKGLKKKLNWVFPGGISLGTAQSKCHRGGKLPTDGDNWVGGPAQMSAGKNPFLEEISKKANGTG